MTTKAPHVWVVEIKKHKKAPYEIAYDGVYLIRHWARGRAKQMRLLWPQQPVRVVKYTGEVQ